MEISSGVAVTFQDAEALCRLQKPEKRMIVFIIKDEQVNKSKEFILV